MLGHEGSANNCKRSLSVKKELIIIKCLNAQSLLCHFDTIEHMLHDENIDILCICETWLDSSIDDKFIKIPEFNVIRCDAGRGSGVCIYIRENFNFSVINTSINKVEGVEDVWVQVQHRKFPSFIIGGVYRHPKALAASFLYLADTFKNICLRNKPVFILGDMNDDLFVKGNNLSKIIRNLNLKQVINKPTRITVNSSTLLDVAITNKIGMIVDSDVIPSPIADHEIISIIINIRKPKQEPETRTYRSRRNYNQSTFCNLLLNKTQSLNGILDTDNVNNQVRILTDVFIECLDECAPLVTNEITRPFAPWLDDNLKKCIAEKNELRSRLKDDRTNYFLNYEFKQTKKQVEYCIRGAKTKHFKNKFNDCRGDSGATWKVVEDMIPGLRNKSKNTHFDEPLQKAEEFNNYFANVGENAFKKSQEGVINNVATTTHEINNYINQSLPNIPSFRPQPVDVNTITLTFKGLRKTNACGSDGIPYTYLKDALPVLVFYITIIVNTSIVTGLYPKLWKHPLVAPLYKSGNVEEVGNYRPISLLPILSKILEKIVSTQLMSFLEKHNLLANSQHGFRSNLSTETALMKINEHIYNNMDAQKISLLLLLDLSKAFDSVCHDILLSKCKQLHIDEFWFKDYLNDRVQSVRINAVLSSPRSMKYGVPQGSILGPILFLIYINDMSDILKKYFLIQYADDTQIIISGRVSEINDLVNRAQTALNDAKKYFQINGLNVNEKKTQCIFIGTRQYISRIPPDIKIHFAETPITPLQSVKNLGLYMDQYMLFDHHINHITRKVNGILLFLNRIKDRFDKMTRVIIVQALAISIINYCSRIWGMTTKEQLDSVQKAQNFAAKIAYGGARKYDHVTPILKDLEWMNIENKVNYDICMFTYKVINQLLPNWLLEFPTVGELQTRPTRQSNDLFVKRTNTDLGARAISVRGPKEWNSIPNNIKNSLTIQVFKNKLKDFFLKK